MRPVILPETRGRAASAEVRARVRERLVATERTLRGPDPAHSTDELVRFLAAVDADELARRRVRVRLSLIQLIRCGRGRECLARGWPEE